MDCFEFLADLVNDSKREDFSVNRALKSIGKFLNLSRVCIYMPNKNEVHYKWIRKGDKELISSLKLPDQDLFSQIPQGIITSDDKIADNSSFLKYYLITPVQMDNLAALIIADTNDVKEWTIQDKKLFEALSTIISNILCKRNYLSEKENIENNLKSLVDSMEEIFIVADRSGIIKFINNSLVRKLGYRSIDIVGTNIREYFIGEKLSHCIKPQSKLDSREWRGLIKSINGNRIQAESVFWDGLWNGKTSLFILSRDISLEKEALERFSKLFENNPAIMVITEIEDGKVLDVNKTFIKKIGLTKEDVIGKTTFEIGLFSSIDARNLLIKQLQVHKRLKNHEIDISKNGKQFTGLLSTEIIRSQNRELLLSVIIDITKQKELENELRDQKERLTNIIEGTQLGTWEWNVQTGETIFNERWASMLGYKLNELEPVDINTWLKLANSEDLKRSEELLNEHFQGKREFYDFEGRMKAKSGKDIWVHDRGKVVQWDENGAPLMMFGTHSDITLKKELEEKLVELSNTDSLTKVYNRRFIFERLNTIVEEWKREKTTFTISILDIDHFKILNDTYGHPAGDFILKEFTKIISNSLRPYDYLGRYGGEEFIIILPNTSKHQAFKKINNILEDIRSGVFNFNGTALRFTFSGGITDSDSLEKISSDELVKMADSLLYKAKKSGRNRVLDN